MSELKIGTGLPESPDLTVAGAARAVEELGFESLWTPDLIIGDGSPTREAALTLAAAAAVTERMSIGFSVLSVPLRPAPWLAAQVATLQALSGDRLLLGAGLGGFPGSPFWQALGVPADGRGARTDATLRALPRLLSAEPAAYAGDTPPLALGPATMPPLLIGGNSPAAMRRAVEFGGWFPSLIAPEDLRPAVTELRALADEQGRPAPSVTVGGHLFLGADVAAREAREAFVRRMVDVHGIPYATAERVPMTAADTAGLAEVFAAYAEAGADRIVTGPAHGDPFEGLATMMAARALL